MNEGADFRTPQSNLTSGPRSTLAHEDLQAILNSSKSNNMSGKDMLKGQLRDVQGFHWEPPPVLTCRRDW